LASGKGAAVELSRGLLNGVGAILICLAT